MQRVKVSIIIGGSTAAIAVGLLFRGVVASAYPALERPPIVGLAHVGLFVGDMAKADEFYGQVLGLAHFDLHKPDGSLFLNYKVNDHQYVEIYPGLKGDDMDRLSHIAFETTDIRKLRAYLAAKGVKAPEELKPGSDKNLSFSVNDPEGRCIEFVQYMKGSLHSSKFGQILPDTKVSSHIIHSGFIVHDRDIEDKFYRDILGFRVMWYGGRQDNVLSWVDMRAPDGDDWIEYMLGNNNPTVQTRGVMNHLALGVTSIQAPYHQVLDRGYKPAQPPKIGRDGKWQLNLYDPDLTRVEMMEFKPVETPCCSPMVTR
jgi:catechol 2,3-dioxygenase-like lactoylglutathione lyase family enzyme